MKRKLSFALALLLLSASAAACSDGGAVSAETTAAVGDTDTAAVTEPAETEPSYEPDDLPEDLDFGGEIVHIFGWERDVPEFTVEEESGDIVNDAIFQRNRTVEERLNVELTYTLAPGNSTYKGDWVKTVKQTTMAGDGANDIVSGYSMAGASLAYNRLLIDLKEQPYLDFAKPWWPSSLIDEATCDGKLYFCSGDISNYMIYYLNAVFFNKSLAQAYDVEDLYTLVREGKWTLDKLAQLSADAYHDLNGDGKKDPADQFGFTLSSVCADSLFFSSGLRTTEIGDDGLPAISPMFGSEKTQSLVAWLNDLFKTNSAYLSLDNDYMLPFLEERAMFFLVDVAFAGDKLRYTDIEYGILPLPKYDEAQDAYYTIPSFTYTLYGIPVDAKTPDRSAAVLECLASEAYRTVSPALFETALKVKYAGDDATSEMYDIIRGGVVFDIGRIFNDSMNSLTYSLFRGSLQQGNSNWASTYKSNSKSLEKQLAKVVGALIAEE
ncbi:MAG: hypothetical protein IKZ09_05055 [Clostridia bacterium]|nr:hypothetical protein [Clostridia bacterium]